MTDRTTDRSTVTDLSRPPVRRATLVRSGVDHTFEVFVRTIGVWWPRQPYSVGGDRVRDVTVEPHLDGRVYETWDDGTVREWGRLLAWQPPHRLAMSWVCTPAVTEVELTFAALGPALTRVAVEHRGWEAFSAAQLAEDCAQPGGYASGGFGRGWATILAALAAAADDHDPRGRGHTMKYVLFYELAEDAMALAQEHFPAHRERIEEFRARGLMLLVGTFSDAPVGAMAVFTTREAAEEFMAADPFLRNGVVSAHRVREWDEILQP